MEFTTLPGLIKGISRVLEHSGKCGYVTDRVANMRGLFPTCDHTLDFNNIRLILNIPWYWHAPLSISPSLFLPPSLTRYNPRCGFLDYIFGLINSWCSAPQLLSALTQTATNW
ncbi:hypothetical protein ACTXT7_012231 [Hymenolepis weldensis]